MDWTNIRIGCAPNFRDMGGLPTKQGGALLRGRLFRSEAIGAPDGEDLDRLTAAGIRLVFDLRGSSERAHAPNDFWKASGAELVEMDVVADVRASRELWQSLRADPTAAGARALMIETYGSLPSACASHLKILFARLAAGAHPALIHCTAGKDRTGFFSAMILHALGVGEEEIMADYLASGDRPNPIVVEATRRIMDEVLGSPLPGPALAALAAVDPAYLGQSFAAIQARHGSVDSYLEQAAGLDRPTRDRLRGQLVG